MAVVNYVGRQIARAWKKTLTVGTSDPTSTITLTGGNSQAVVVTPTSATVATTASEIASALQAAGGVFSELTVTVSGAVVTLEGPADGAIVTFSKADAGTNATTLATVFTPLSPHDAADVLNWSTGALPVDATDSIVLENGDVAIKYNLTAIAARELVSPYFVRRDTYTGPIGLPTANPLGFPEYRDTELSVEAAAYDIEAAQGDQADQLRILNTYTGGAAAVTIRGSGTANAQLGSEAVVIRGLPASSTLTCVGGSVSVAPLQGQACTILTLVAINSVVSIGPSVTLSGTVRFKDCVARVKSSWTTSLTHIGGQVEVLGAAAGVIVVEAGTMVWRSTGSVGAAPVLGSGATFDLSQCPGSGVAAVTFNMYAGSTLNDPAGRGGNWAYKTVHCTPQEITVVGPDDATYTKS